MKTETIEYQEVKIKLPKLIIDWIGFIAEREGKTTEQQLLHNIVDSVRMDLEDMDAQTIIEMLHLDPVFNEVLKIDKFLGENQTQIGVNEEVYKVLSEKAKTENLSVNSYLFQIANRIET